MNSKIKRGLFFGIFMTIILIGEKILFEDVTTTNEIVGTIVMAIVAGAIAGFLFSFLIEKFMSSKAVNGSSKIDINEDEKLIFETAANHFKGAEGVGGKLYLTDKRLVFKSHKFNVQTHELCIPINKIAKVERYKVLSVVNNGLRIQTTEGITERFVVEKASEWFTHLQNFNFV
jgi:hypothetical protein